MRLIIPGSVPEGKKSLKDPPPTGKFIPASKAEAWSHCAVSAIREQLKDTRLTKPASISISYFTGDAKRREPLVIMKTVLFALRAAGVVSHERLFGGGGGTTVTFKHCGLNGRPRVELEIN